MTTSLHLRAYCPEDVGSSTSHNLMGFHGLLQGYLFLDYRSMQWSVNQAGMMWGRHYSQSLNNIFDDLIWIVKAIICNRPLSHMGLWDVKFPTLYRQSAHRWRHSCQPYAPAPLYSTETLVSCFWYSFLLEAEQIPGPSLAGKNREIERIYSPHRISNSRPSGL
jgi:hypothetical protein